MPWVPAVPTTPAAVMGSTGVPVEVVNWWESPMCDEYMTELDDVRQGRVPQPDIVGGSK